MTLAGKGVCGESLRIIADLLELIVGCTTWPIVITSSGWISQKVEFCVSSNADIIISGIVGFYGLTVMVDLLPLLLTKNLKMWADFSGIEKLN